MICVGRMAIAEMPGDPNQVLRVLAHEFRAGGSGAATTSINLLSSSTSASPPRSAIAFFQIEAGTPIPALPVIAIRRR